MDAGTLIASELVGNAVRHISCRLVRVSVRRVTDDLVRNSVTDKSRALPKIDPVADGDETGHGLVLVGALSHRWAYDEMRWGKTVWAELAVPACCRYGCCRRTSWWASPIRSVAWSWPHDHGARHRTARLHHNPAADDGKVHALCKSWGYEDIGQSHPPPASSVLTVMIRASR
ncbi:ATP-binding protein [Streptomyces sp. NPDC020379]|uniref:ATP-binding protein n=1 Tax=Streptomyces sp. NPDC020379 TaxID=3365071 RepID=UPI0037A5E7A1